MALQAATIDQCLLASRHGRPGPQGLCLALNVELLCVRPSTNTPGARCIYVDVCGRRDGTTLHGTMGFSGVISLLVLRVYGVVCALPTLSVAGIIYVHYSHPHRLKYFGVMPKKVSNKPPSIEKIVPSPSKKRYILIHDG